MAVPVTFQAPTVVSPEIRGRSCASIKIINDNVTETNETFRVSLELDHNDRSVMLGNLSSATVTIMDDDRRKGNQSWQLHLIMYPCNITFTCIVHYITQSLKSMTYIPNLALFLCSKEERKEII